jgi:two-component system, NtrC family, response regulator HydG
MNKKVLIVEDQFIEANNLQLILERAGYKVCGIARSVHVALSYVEKDKPDLVLLDIFLQGNRTGIDLAKILREKKIAFVYLSANSNKETLEAAKATQPYGFLVKPFREKDVLVMLEIANYWHNNQLEKVTGDLHKQRHDPNSYAGVTADNFFGIIGKSTKMHEVLAQVKMVAPADTSVLILGESGTGKERIAECIHELSPRASKPLVKVNCTALPGSLIESILFGHEKGSFTGAIDKRIGKFEQAHRGTIFLDEIGEMPADLQVKLLRVLQEKEIERLGGDQMIETDVRVIAATNRNLDLEVAEGRFRLDLYYRLNVFPILLPSLRQRIEDIPLLTKHFLEIYSKKLGRPLHTITQGALKDLQRHDWPGNVRELQHVIERAVLMNPEATIRHVDIPVIAGKSSQDSKIKTIEENERDYIIEVLRKCQGKVSGKSGAAELLGINVSTLNSKIKKLGISKTVTIEK